MDRTNFAPLFGRRLRHVRRLCGLNQASLDERSRRIARALLQDRARRGRAVPGRHSRLQPDPWGGSRPPCSCRTAIPLTKPARAGIDWAAVHGRQGLFFWTPGTGMSVWPHPCAGCWAMPARPARRPGTCFQAVFGSADGEAARAAAALAGVGDRQGLGVRFCRRDGETRRGSLVLDWPGPGRDKPYGIGVLTDVSEPSRLERVVRAEAALIDRRVRERTARLEREADRQRREIADLAEREARYRGVFENVPLGVALTTPTGAISRPIRPWPGCTATPRPGNWPGRCATLPASSTPEPGRREAMEQELPKPGPSAASRPRCAAATAACSPPGADVRAVADAEGNPCITSISSRTARPWTRPSIRCAATPASSRLLGHGRPDDPRRPLRVRQRRLRDGFRPRTARRSSAVMSRIFSIPTISPAKWPAPAGLRRRRTVHFEFWVDSAAGGRRYLSIHYSPWAEERVRGTPCGGEHPGHDRRRLPWRAA